MKNLLTLIVAGMTCAPFAQAQNGGVQGRLVTTLPAAPATRLQPVYVETPTVVAAPVTVTTVQVPLQAQAPAQTTLVAQAAPVQAQAPTKLSRADELRKQRELVEQQTEYKMIERLEDDRILAEKRRLEAFSAPLTPAPTGAAVGGSSGAGATTGAPAAPQTLN